MKLIKRSYRPKVRNPDGTVSLGDPVRAATWTVRFGIKGRFYEVSTGLRDRRAAEIRASEIVDDAEREAAGDPDPFKAHRETPIATHLDDFLKALKPSVCEQHYYERSKYLKDFLAWSGAKRLADLEQSRVMAWVDELRRPIVIENKTTKQKTEKTRSARTLNSRIGALKQLTGWLFDQHRIEWDPFGRKRLKRLNVATDRRRVRRALTPRQFTRLLVAARRRPMEQAKRERVLKGVSESQRAFLVARGEARALVYLLLGGTGLRVGELKALKWGDVDLDRGIVTVPAKAAKSKREQVVDLSPVLVGALKGAWRGAEPSAALIPTGAFPTLRTFDLDLARARVPKVDERGRVVDRHALRTSFISWLSSTGAHPRVAQSLARHSSIALTMGTYTDTALLNTKGAVARLPLPSLRKTSEPLSSGLSSNGVLKLPLRASTANTSAEVESAPNGRSACEDVQRTATRVVERRGIEPLTFRLPA